MADRHEAVDVGDTLIDVATPDTWLYDDGPVGRWVLILGRPQATALAVEADRLDELEAFLQRAQAAVSAARQTAPAAQATLL